MMDKRSSEHIPCSQCDKDAVVGTNPPLCKECLEKSLALSKKASDAEQPSTLKELDAR